MSHTENHEQPLNLKLTCGRAILSQICCICLNTCRIVIQILTNEILPIKPLLLTP